MNKLVVPSIWIGTVLIALMLIFKVGGIGSCVSSVFCVLIAALTTMSILDPSKKK